MQGIVKWFHPDEGYGFIIGDEDEEFFVTYQGIPSRRPVYRDEIVTFEPADANGGANRRAVNVERVDE